MKKVNHILIIACIILVGCTNKNLDKTKASELIINDNSYPRVLDYDVFCGDPTHAKRMFNAGLEEKGFVSVVLNQKLKDLGKPLIVFKDSSAPYFLPTPKEDRANEIQKVKMGTEYFDHITDIKINSEGKKAIVTYTTKLDYTIFASLWHNPLKKVRENKAYFLLTQQGWAIVKRKEFELLEF